MRGTAGAAEGLGAAGLNDAGGTSATPADRSRCAARPSRPAARRPVRGRHNNAGIAH